MRSKHEYGLLNWYPTYNKRIQNVEPVQRQFAKFLYLRKFVMYPDPGMNLIYSLLLV